MAKQETIDKVKSLLEGHCYAPLKESAEKWLEVAQDKAQGAKEKIQESEMIDQLKEAIPTVEEITEFFSSDDCIKKFGKEAADKIKEHAEELKKSGEKFCDCEACQKAKSILKDFGEKLD